MNMKTYVNIFWVMICLFLPWQEGMADSYGKYGATFLQVKSGARQVAMGEAFTSLSYNDINLMHYNIGGLGSIENVMLAINYHEWIDDTQQGALGLALPTRFGVIGFGFNYFDEGQLQEVDEFFRPTGSILKSNDIIMTLGFGSHLKLLNQKFLFGGDLKVVRQDLTNESATSFGMDLGLLLWLKYLSFGITAQNFSLTQLKFDQKGVSLPETYRGGVGAHFPLGQYLNWRFGFDLAYTPEEQLRSYTGTEFVINDLLFIRAGYKIHDTDVNRWALGLGLNIPMPWLASSETRFDYAYTPMDAFESSTHRFSLLFRFGVHVPSGPLNVADGQKIQHLNEQLQKELEAAERARLSAEESEKRTRALEDTMRVRLERIRKIAEASGGKIEVRELVKPDAVPGEISDKIQVTMRINFDFDKSDIRPEEIEILDRVGRILNTYPESQVFISGHTDNIGTDEYNILLSQRRVDSVLNFLSTTENVDSHRYYNPIGYGELKPVADNTTEDGRLLNRRVDFIIYTMDARPEMPDGSAIKDIIQIDESTYHIVGNGVLKYNHTVMTDPDRLVIDLPNIFVLMEQTTFEFFRQPVTRVRLGYHPNEVFSRVVFDLYRPAQYDITTDKNLIIIRFR